MKHGTFKKLLAIVLAMTVILSMGFTAVSAEEETLTQKEETLKQVKVVADDQGTTVTASAEEGKPPVEVKENGSTISVTVVAEGDASPAVGTLPAKVNPVTVSIENDISAGEISGDPTSPDIEKRTAVFADGSSFETAPQVTVDLHDVSVGTSESAGLVYGVYAEGKNVTVTGADVSATVTEEGNANTSAQAVFVIDGATVTAESVSATGYGATAVRVYSGSSAKIIGTAKAEACESAAAIDAHNGTVTADSATAVTTGKKGTSSTAVQSLNSTVKVNQEATAKGENGSVRAIDIKYDGSVTVGSATAEVTGKGSAVAAYANSSSEEIAKDPKAEITINQEATAKAVNGTAEGIIAERGGSVTAGNVTAEVTGTGNAVAVQARGENAAVTINQEATAKVNIGDAAGIRAKEGGFVTAGDVTAEVTGEGKATAVAAGSGAVVAAGDVTAEGVEKAVGIDVSGDAEVAADTVTAKSEKGEAIAINVAFSGEEDTVSSVTIKGDAESSGIGVNVSESGAGKAIVEIDGTLNVAEGGTPVCLGSDVTKDNIEITVWKVEVNGEQAKEGEIVKPCDGDETAVEQTAAAKAVEESIQYIIRIRPEQTGNIRSSREKAKANETFIVTVTPPEGQILDGVYTDEGEKIEATLNDDGTYSVTVRVGGGMYLSAKFSDKPADETKPAEKTKPDYDDSLSVEPAAVYTDRIWNEGIIYNAQDGKWYFWLNNRLQLNFSGIVLYGGHWYMIRSGVSESSGSYHYDGSNFVFTSGQLPVGENCLWQNPDDKCWYLWADGHVQTQYTGLVRYGRAEFYVENGQVQTQ